MKRSLTIALGLCLVAAPLATSTLVQADESTPDTNRLVIVDGNTDQVIYDDGRDDLFCVTRLHRWRDEYGYRHRYRTMHCH